MTRTQKIGATVAVLVAVLLGLALTIDALARSVLEATLSRAVGTEATVESLDLGIFSGQVTLEGLTVANPEGFESPRFLSLRRGRLGAGPAGDTAATVAIPEIRMQNVGSGGGGAVTLSELAGLTLQAVLGAVARESGDLPGRLGGLLRGQLEQLPGGVDLQLPGGADTEGLGEQAEEELRKLVPGQDGGG